MICAGVLDTEELAIVNSTFRKTQDSRLSGIAEESRRSGESTTSTLESESWAMENIETLLHLSRGHLANQIKLQPDLLVAQNPPGQQQMHLVLQVCPRTVTLVK
jgi:hypothetical protein